MSVSDSKVIDAAAENGEELVLLISDHITWAAAQIEHLQLLQNVREEFEHNLAQQLYVAGTTWSAVMNAKEELVNQINETFEQLKDEEDVSIIAQTLVALPNPMVDQAVAVLKRDFERLL